MAFDDLTGLRGSAHLRTQEAVERTHRWLERSITEFNNLTKVLPDEEKPLLFGIFQGGLNKKLRLQSLELVQSLPVDGIAVGGLSVVRVGQKCTKCWNILRLFMIQGVFAI